MERGWPLGVDPRAQMTTFAYLLFALLTADMNDAERERSRKRFENNRDDIFAAAAVEPHATLAARNAAPARLSRAMAEVFREPRRIPSADCLHGRIPPRP